MSSNAEDGVPEGWEMHTSPSSDVVFYVNKHTKKGQWPKPFAHGSRTHTPRALPLHYDSIPSTPTPSGAVSPTSTVVSSPASRDQIIISPVEEIRCSHILIKHNESRRPMSWRSDQIRRTKEEALVIIRDFRDQIMNKETKFEDIAKIFSDCSSAKRYGDLGRFKRGQMQKAFEMVAFKLKIGQLSQPVDTKSGIHLILRTA